MSTRIAFLRTLRLFACAVVLLVPAELVAEEPVTDIRITTLSTMLADLQGVGEWGFSALVETSHGAFLFDTGERPGTVLQNARELGVDLSEVEDVILTHHHFDHTGGLVTLRSAYREHDSAALSRTHVGKGMFLPREMDLEALARLPRRPPQELLVGILEVKAGYEDLGGEFVVHDGPHQLAPGIWLTGPIPRPHPERNWTPFEKIRAEGELLEDDIPEDLAMVIDTPKGLVVIVGCAHAGLVNTLESARTIVPGKPVHAVIGGFHLLNQTDEQVEWSGKMMKEFGVEFVIGAHCTGINAVAGLREASGLTRESSVVGSVGTVFTLEDGIRPGALNR